jgi:hypothetical protein
MTPIPPITSHSASNSTFLGAILGLMRPFPWIVTLMLFNGFASSGKATCPPPTPKQAMERSEVYKATPFKSGERAVYEVTWAGLKAGDAVMEVRPPRKHHNLWHRVFHMEAQTGDWFKAVFVARDIAEAVSQPWDFGVAHFYMEQDEGKMFGKRFQQKKWLEFDHDKCVVTERISDPGKPERKNSFELLPGANDSMGVVFNLRTQQYYLGKKIQLLVYTSEKNWWLEANPVAFEMIETAAGTFKTVKLKLQTYIGKDLQQKGDVWAWIAVDHPARPMVQIQGEIKIGSIWIKLKEFQPGS